MSEIPQWFARFVFHHVRLYGWIPVGLAMLRSPYQRWFLAFYALARKTPAWRSLAHNFFSYGLKNSPARIESALSEPLKPASEKRYLCTLHPHGLLCDAWHCVVGKNQDAFAPDNPSTCGVPGLKMFLCFSPVIQYVPGHQECYRERCGGASAKDVERVLRETDCVPTVCPGGFAEAVWCWSDSKYEYSWLKNNTRFMAVAIKNKLDIVPSYSYGLTSMYKTNTFYRQELAETAQKYAAPLVLATGKLGMMPFHENVVSVVYDPFPVDKYTMDNVEQALEDYSAYLKSCFDKDKAKYGMADKEMLFIGPRSTGRKAKPVHRSSL
eukprot:CAMPEP_0197650248 /NCGR_PEP_ID=MMETSP1338-20131121/30824_1 /TAXON_ID=43686 ORGANISM="Pelagodinium beii, Strain RCC1491" /NCGR_SAMPLE_ID=MMETSP1338 /ASSEMBLY_ACC=CAM_ASM_000754 /LENGTH=323 /DNA_ID=CAMNT_0043224611 /DNA_START=52 /DNA_END=1023 /DNA_ORIENTATION=+